METFKLGCVESCIKDVEALRCHHAVVFSVCAAFVLREGCSLVGLGLYLWASRVVFFTPNVACSLLVINNESKVYVKKRSCPDFWSHDPL